MPKGVYVRTEDHKKHLSESRKKSEFVKEAMVGDNNPSKRPEIREKISAALKGKPKSQEHRDALAAAHTGKTMSPEHRAIMSAANKGKPKSAEHRAKIAAARRAMGPRSEETKEKLRNISLETRKFRSEMASGENNPVHRIRDYEKYKENLILSLNDIWYGGVKYPQDKRAIYCEKWTPELRERIRACWGYESALSGKTKEENGNRELDCHHVYFQKKACCHWDEDTQGYYAIIERKRYYIKGDPNKFVPLTCDEHSKTKFDKLYWIKYFEDLIESKGGKSYFTKEEMREFQKNR
jgi:hypothetical protein